MFWRIVEILMGLFCIGMGLFNKEFAPIGWTTMLIWGRARDARIPRWIGGTFYGALGLALLYAGSSGKYQ